MIQRQRKRKSFEIIIFCIAVFAAMLVFFTVLHPIPIMDEDDVIYTVIVRKAIPLPGAWNPSRMMPEVLTSLCGNLAALCTVLGFGSFIDCQVVIYGVFLSLFITAYVRAFFRLLEKRFCCSRFQAMCLSILFLLLHFLVFRTEYSRNSFMFHTYDACCVFYYTVPALLGCTIVMRFMETPDDPPIINGEDPVRESMLLLVLYFEMFSNLFGSAVLAAYAGYRILRNVVQRKRVFCKRTALWHAIVFCWMLAAILEATGGRAADTRSQAVEGTLPFSSRLGQAVLVFVKTMWYSNTLFRVMVIVVAASSVFLVVVQREKTNSSAKKYAFGETAVWGFATSIAVLLLCAVVEPLYAGRPETVFPVVFVLYMVLMQGMIFILYHFPVAERTLPILLIIVYSMTNTRFLTFQDSNPLLLDGHVAVAIENEIYESIILAANAGETEVTIEVIHSNEESNWPHDGRIGDPMAEFFLKYGIIDHEIRVHTKPSDEMNKRYHIDNP